MLVAVVIEMLIILCLNSIIMLFTLVQTTVKAGGTIMKNRLSFGKRSVSKGLRALWDPRQVLRPGPAQGARLGSRACGGCSSKRKSKGRRPLHTRSAEGHHKMKQTCEHTWVTEHKTTDEHFLLNTCYGTTEFQRGLVQISHQIMLQAKTKMHVPHSHLQGQD